MTDDVRYRLDQSAELVAEVRRLLELARRQGRLREFGLALKWIREELERTPNRFGESREWYDAAEIQARCGFARPLYVGYGVYEPGRRVFLRRFVLLP